MQRPKKLIMCSGGQKIMETLQKTGFLLVSYNCSESKAIYRSSEFLEALKTPTKKEAGSKNSEFSEKWTILPVLAIFWMKKSLTYIKICF